MNLHWHVKSAVDDWAALCAIYRLSKQKHAMHFIDCKRLSLVPRASQGPWGQKESITWLWHATAALLGVVRIFNHVQSKLAKADLLSESHIFQSLFFFSEEKKRTFGRFWKGFWLHVWTAVHHWVVHLITPGLQKTAVNTAVVFFQHCLYFDSRENTQTSDLTPIAILWRCVDPRLYQYCPRVMCDCSPHLVSSSSSAAVIGVRSWIVGLVSQSLLLIRQHYVATGGGRETKPTGAGRRIPGNTVHPSGLLLLTAVFPSGCCSSVTRMFFTSELIWQNLLHSIFCALVVFLKCGVSYEECANQNVGEVDVVFLSSIGCCLQKRIENTH